MPEYGRGIIRTGLHKPLEDIANQLLRESLSTVTRNADKSDILTPWKEHDRKKREISVMSGTPDPALRRGIFSRVVNPDRPHLNSLQGQVPQQRSLGHGPSAWDSE